MSGAVEETVCGGIKINCGSINCDLLKPLGKVYPSLYTRDEMHVVKSSALFDDVDAAVDACVLAQEKWMEVSKDVKKSIVEDIRTVAVTLAHDLALFAVSDTGRGNHADKVTKQILSATKTPGPESIVPRVTSGSMGITIIDYAPYGVFAAVTPVTNPTATIINNTITMISGGNGIVFNPHPSAAACTNRAVAIFNEVIKNGGGPDALIASIRVPTIQSGGALLTHAKTAANLVTGGPAVVKVAVASGKKSFCAGPGNPPVVVDETASIPEAAKSIYEGASFDNNMICSDEKEVFVVESVADKLIEGLKAVGAHIATKEEIEKLLKLVLKEDAGEYKHSLVDAGLVGKEASFIMEKIGVTVPSTCRLVIAEVSEGHQFIWTELLMPILAVHRVKSFEAGVELAYKAEYGYRHTSSLYTNAMNRVGTMGRKMNTSIYTVNGPHTAGLAAGGEGYTSFSITGHTGEGLTTPTTFVRERKMVCVGQLNFN